MRPNGQREVEGLVRAVLTLRPLIDVVEGPLRLVAGPRADALQALLDRITARLGAPRLVVGAAPPPGQRGPFELVVDEQLELARYGMVADALSPAEVDAVVDRVATEDGLFARAREVVSADARLPAYASGSASRPAVIIASACGMPAKLCDGWMRSLARESFVMTWESRGLFGESDDFDGLAYDAFTQAEDLFAVLDAYGVESAHVMGFCTGAVIALAAAAARPERVPSLSLWHGSYELGAEVPKTAHQRNMQELMTMAAESRDAAAMLHEMLCQSMLRGTPPDRSQLVLYPYATAELLYRYCKVNGAVVDTDLTEVLATVRQPVLVVTSEDDDTAHPAASREVAARLADATLHVEPTGNHMSLFAAGERLEGVARDFLARTRTGAGASVQAAAPGG